MLCVVHIGSTRGTWDGKLANASLASKAGTPKPRTGSSLSCLMLLSWTRATIAFSSRTASFLIAAIASSTVLSAKDPLAFRVMSLRRFSVAAFQELDHLVFSGYFRSVNVFLPTRLEIRPVLARPGSGNCWSSDFLYFGSDRMLGAGVFC